VYLVVFILYVEIHAVGIRTKFYRHGPITQALNKAALDSVRIGNSKALWENGAALHSSDQNIYIS